MPTFLYRVSDRQGRSIDGMIEAPSAQTARTLLRDRGHLVIAMEEERPGAGRLPWQSRAMSPRRLALVTRQLATLVGSDVRIEEALSILAPAQPPRIAALLLTLRAALADGRSLAAAMADHPADFPGMYVATVRAGEEAGRLARVLDHLAHHVEQRSRNRMSVQLAMLYPILLACVSLGIVTMLMIFVLPDIIRVFDSRAAELPVLTRGLLAISAGVGAFWPALLALIVAAILAWGAAWRHEANRLVVHRWLAQMGPTRLAVERQNAALFSESLATLVESGVPLVAALTASADAVPNLHIRQRITDTARKVSQGIRLRQALDEAGCFPPMLIALVASGEANGRLGQALGRAATDQRQELDAWVKAVVALVEPGILLVMGGIVMLIVLAIMLPIISMNGLLGP